MVTQNLASLCLSWLLESEVSWWRLPCPHKSPWREGRLFSSPLSFFNLIALQRRDRNVLKSSFVVLIPYALWVFLFHARVFFIVDNSLCLWPQLTLLGRSLSLSSRQVPCKCHSKTRFLLVHLLSKTQWSNAGRPGWRYCSARCRLPSFRDPQTSGLLSSDTSTGGAGCAHTCYVWCCVCTCTYTDGREYVALGIAGWKWRWIALEGIGDASFRRWKTTLNYNLCCVLKKTFCGTSITIEVTAIPGLPLPLHGEDSISLSRRGWLIDFHWTLLDLPPNAELRTVRRTFWKLTLCCSLTFQGFKHILNRKDFVLSV